jgi:hypothetical protein
MIVQAAWPGATINDTLLQVTERIERTLQETPSLDFLRSYTSPGLATIFVNLKGKTPASEVPDIWYHVRKSVGDMRHTLPAGVVSPGFNDEFGDTFGIIYGFTADGFTQRQLRDYVDDIRSRRRWLRRFESRCSVRRTSGSSRVLDAAARRPGDRPLRADRRIVAERGQPAGTSTGDEKLLCASPAQNREEQIQLRRERGA